MIRKWQRHLIRYLVIITFFFISGIGFFLGAGFFLANSASNPEKADAVIVLRGDGGLRYTHGIDLFKAGYVSNVLILDEKNEKILKEFSILSGSRRGNIYFIAGSSNTYDEAINSLDLIQTEGWRNVIVVTDPPHIRRAAWTWRHVFRNTGLKFAVVQTNPVWWDAQHWWRNDRSRQFVFMEYAKLAYYILVYGIGIPGDWLPCTGNR